ncbi:MAG: hypothetical protein DBX55_02580 [Verrucomicrobia bacterium]|nr:MAG: hypothetical protein DBX55_02580 [Verrucomicrobiota bacterium]
MRKNFSRLPAETESSQMRKMRSPPKSGGKDYKTERLFMSMQKMNERSFSNRPRFFSRPPRAAFGGGHGLACAAEGLVSQSGLVPQSGHLAAGGYLRLLALLMCILGVPSRRAGFVGGRERKGALRRNFGQSYFDAVFTFFAPRLLRADSTVSRSLILKK